MNSFRKRIPTAANIRLAAIAVTTANLKALLSELEWLRERVRKAQSRSA
jgi:hypothetical protein